MLKILDINNIHSFFKKDFVRNVFILFSGNAVSRLIPILSMLVLSRLFSPEEFGVFFLYTAILIVLTEISTLKYELAIMLPKDNFKAYNLFMLSVLISISISVLLFIFISIGKPLMFKYIEKIKPLGFWIYFIPFSVLLMGLVQASNYWLNREKKYRKISQGRIYKSVSTSVTQIGSGFFHMSKTGLITGAIIGQISQAVYFITKVSKLFKTFQFKLTLKEVAKVAKEYKDIRFYNTSIGLLNNLSMYLPIFLLTAYYNETVVGYYGISLRLIGETVGVFKQSVTEVFFASASKKYHESLPDFKRLIRKTLINLSLIGVLPFLILFFFSPFIFKILLGAEWIVAGKYTQLLIPWLFLMFIGSPLSSVITIIRKQKYFVIYDVLLLSARFLGLYFGYRLYNDPICSIAFYSLAGVFFNLVLLFFYLAYSSKNGNN